MRVCARACPNSLGGLLLHFGRKPKTGQDDGGPDQMTDDVNQKLTAHQESDRNASLARTHTYTPGGGFVGLDLLQLAVNFRQTDALHPLGPESKRAGICQDVTGRSERRRVSELATSPACTHVPLARRALRRASSRSRPSLSASLSRTLCSAVVWSPATSCSTWRMEM